MKKAISVLMLLTMLFMLVPSVHADPGGEPGVQASMVRCNTYSTNMDWGTVRRMQHEWSHGYGAQHTGDGGTVCTSNCINNSGFNNSFLPVADVWCSRCKTAMSAHLGDY